MKLRRDREHGCCGIRTRTLMGALLLGIATAFIGAAAAPSTSCAGNSGTPPNTIHGYCDAEGNPLKIELPGLPGGSVPVSTLPQIHAVSGTNRVKIAHGAGGGSGRKTPLLGAFEIISSAVSEDKVPGAIGLVSQQGRVLHEVAQGHCDMARKRPMTTRTLCWIASITKPITAAAAMKLVDEGKLSLDDHVEKYLPQFKNQKAPDGKHYPITIRQLMSHSSGIQSNPPLRPQFFFEAEWYARDISEVALAVAETPLQFKPGSEVRYSNAAPYVLARIIELRSGMRYDRFVQTRILDPLGMSDTWFALPASAADRVAEVLRREDGKEDTTFFRFDPAWRMNMAMPDGGLFSTPADVVKFTQMFIRNDGSILSKESVRTMLTEQAPGWGLGWALEDDGSFFHTGSSGTLTWGNPRTEVAGALFCQIQDYKTKAHESLKLREAFREAVDDALSGNP